MSTRPYETRNGGKGVNKREWEKGGSETSNSESEETNYESEETNSESRRETNPKRRFPSLKTRIQTVMIPGVEPCGSVLFFQAASVCLIYFVVELPLLTTHNYYIVGRGKKRAK